MLCHVAVCTRRHKVRGHTIPRLAPLDLMADLQVLKRAALLTPTSVPLQHPLLQALAPSGTSLPKPLSGVLSPTRPPPCPRSYALWKSFQIAPNYVTDKRTTRLV